MSVRYVRMHNKYTSTITEYVDACKVTKVLSSSHSSDHVRGANKWYVDKWVASITIKPGYAPLARRQYRLFWASCTFEREVRAVCLSISISVLA